MSNQQSYQRFVAIGIIVIIALLGMNGYLWYTKITQDKLIAKQNVELIETEKLMAESEKTYYEALSELDEMRTANAELNSVIDSQKEELKAQKQRISRLIVSERDLEAARDELSKLRVMTQKHIAEIAKLREENEQLSQANVALEEQNVSLTQEVSAERLAKEELESARTTLVSQNERLELEKEILAEKVTKAASILVADIEVDGYRVKNNGKESFSRRASNIEGLKICFETLDNPIAPAGEERFHVRVIDPLGATLAIDDLGSGVINDHSTDTDVRYTQYRDIDYAQAPSNVCMNWQPGIPFQPGIYKVEVYNKGYLAGASDFELK